MPLRVGHWGGGDIWRITSGEFPSNAYICGMGNGQAILIDGGLDALSFDCAVNKLGLVPIAMLCTHGHFDHAGSAAYFQNKYGCPFYMHGADRKLLQASNFLLMAFKLNSRIEQPSTITTIRGGETVEIGGYPATFHATPGHTPGSCVIEFGKALFTGDTLFCKGFGLSRMPGEDPKELKRSVLTLWPMLTRERFVYPGHGSHATGYDVRTKNLALLEFLGRSDSQSL